MKLNREGVQLNAEERNKRNQNWTTLEDELSGIGDAIADGGDAKKLAENVQAQVNALVVQGDSSVEARQARVDAKGVEAATLKARLDAEQNAVTAQLADKASKGELQGLSLAYKESYDTLALLQSAYPIGNEYNHTVKADGMIYTYKNGWISTGIQANGSGIANNTVGSEKLGEELQSTIKFNSYEWESGAHLSSNGGIANNYPDNIRTVKKYPFKKGDKIFLTDPIYKFKLYFYDLSGNYTGHSGDAKNTPYTILNDCLANIGVNASGTNITTIINQVGAKIYSLRPTLPFEELDQKISEADTKLSFISDSISVQDKARGVIWKNEYVPSELTPADSGLTILSSVIRVNAGDSVKLQSPLYTYKIAYCTSEGVITSRTPYQTAEKIFDGSYYVRIQLARADTTSLVSPSNSINIKISVSTIVLNTIKQPISLTDIYNPSKPYLPPNFSNGRLNLYYAQWDELMNNNPSYISKTLLANDATGLPIYMYDFNPLSLQKLQRSSEDLPLPKIVYFGGTHGSEKTSSDIDWIFFKDLVENWSSDKILQMMRFNVRFIVVPALCPWGYDNNSRVNSNGVNINRNFPTDFSVTSVGQDYSGLTPASEIETQTAITLLSQHNEAKLVVDSHNTENVSSGKKLGYLAHTNGHEQLGVILSSYFRTLGGVVGAKYPLIKMENPVFETKTFFAIGTPDPIGSMVNHFSAMGISGVLTEKATGFGYENSYDAGALQDIGVMSVGNLILSAILNSNLITS